MTKVHLILFLKRGSNTKEAKKNVEDKVVEEKEEELDVNSNEVVSLIKYFDILNSAIDSGGGKMFARMYKSEHVSVTDLSNSEKGYIAVSNIIESNGASQEISAIDVENMVKKVFGDVNYTNGDIPAYCCAFDKIFYISSNNTYKTSDTVCGGVCNPNVQYKIVKAKKGDILNIDVAVVSVNCDVREINGVAEVYALFYSDLNEQNKVYEDANSVNFNFDKYLDNTTKYTYTFKKR